MADQLTLFTTGTPNKKRTPVKPLGYVARPGTGPNGESCRGCQHLQFQIGELGRFRPRCELTRAHWTGSRITEIDPDSPACAKWQRRDV